MNQLSHPHACWILGFLVLFATGCTSSPKRPTGGPVCAVHGVRLEVGVAPVRYGLPPGDTEDDKRKAREFPNSNSYVLGGCVLGSKGVEVVAYCPKCREGDPVAEVRVTSDGVLAGALDAWGVEVDVMFVQFPASVVGEVMRAGDLSTEVLMRLFRQGKGTILCAPRVVTPPGSEGTVKSLTEVRFPVSVRLAPPGETTNLITSAQLTVTPEDCQTRDVGVQLSVLPELKEGGRCVILTLAPEFVYPPEWRTNEISVSTADGTKIAIAYQQPLFHAMSLSTTVTLPLGETVVVGGGLPGRDRETIVYLFVSARIPQIASKEKSSNQPGEGAR